MNNKSAKNFDLGKNIIDKATETAIASQVKSAQNIQVDIDSQPSQLATGKVEAIAISCEKVVAVQDLSLEQIDIASEDLSINLLTAILGDISLVKPGNFQIEIVFTEADCDRLLNSSYVKILLQNLMLDLEQQPVSFYLQQASCQLKEQGVVYLEADLVLESAKTTQTRFQIQLQFCQNGTQVKFLGGKYLEDPKVDLQHTVAILNKVKDLIYLRTLHTKDLSVDILKIEVSPQQLILGLNAQVKRLPDSIEESIESLASDI